MNKRHYRTASEHEADMLNAEINTLKAKHISDNLSLVEPLLVFAIENPDVIASHGMHWQSITAACNELRDNHCVETGTSFAELRQ